MSSTNKKVFGLKAKLFAVVFTLVSASVGIGALTYLGFTRSDAILNEITARVVPDLAVVGDLEVQVARARRFEKELFLFSSVQPRDSKIMEKQEKYKEDLLNTYKAVGAHIGKVKTLASGGADGATASAEVDRYARQAVAAYGRTMESLDPLIEELLSGRSFLEVSAAYEPYKKNVNALEESVKSLHKAVFSVVSEHREEAARVSVFLSWGLLGVGLLVVVLVPTVGFWAAHRLGASMERLMTGIRKSATGHFEPIEVTGRDEFAEIARVFNDTMGQLQASIRTEEERSEEQKSLIAFLEVVSEASEGNLCAKAPVTADAFGSIADAYNLMMDSLSELLADVRAKANEVGSESRQMLEIFRGMEKGAEAQAEQVHQATTAVGQTSETSLEIARKLDLAQEVSGRVDQVTGEGSARVQQSIEGMQLIRVTVQVINKKMKSLSERLLEIGTISQLISEIATRTTILAMNASIEAARAGDQGRGFLVISDEIKRLADKSAEATKQIGGIIKAIQTEAGEVTAALEEETRTVEEQTRVAQRTGEAFVEIQSALGESREVTEEIYGLSRRQRELTEETVRSMRQVSDISTQTIRMVKDSAGISQGLNAVSETLLGALSRFQLPDGETEVVLLEEEIFGGDDVFRRDEEDQEVAAAL